MNAARGVASYVVDRLREDGTLRSVSLSMMSAAGLTISDNMLMNFLLVASSILNGINALLPSTQGQKQ